MTRKKSSRKKWSKSLPRPSRSRLNPRNVSSAARSLLLLHQGQALALPMGAGLLLLTCGVYGNVIRFLYPLTIPDAQFTKALDILARVLTR